MRGFTLIETLVAIAVFGIIAFGILQFYLATLESIKFSRAIIIAAALATEQIELVRNLPYVDVGLIGGVPSGKLEREQVIVRNNLSFNIRYTIRSKDDSFDKTFNEGDLSPSDYKFVEIEISCVDCNKFSPLRFITTVSPKGLETQSNNGALLVEVIDASGASISGANILIRNVSTSPEISISETSNLNGEYLIVDAPTSTKSYQITASKAGYSTEKTYLPGAPENPNPIKEHATVASGVTTAVIFQIDRLSEFNIATVNEMCSNIPSTDFSLKGTKLIGADPDILKFPENNYATNIYGRINIPSLEWDAYHLEITGSNYDLAGSSSLLPVALNPGTSHNLYLTLNPKTSASLLTIVKDGSSGMPLQGASVNLSKIGYDETLLTGRGYLRQTDWSGGPGQVIFSDSTRYFNQDGNIDDSTSTGQIRLKWLETEQRYAAFGWLVSSSFDTGADSNFYNIYWEPLNQPPDAGLDSVKFQIAASDDPSTTTWDFLGPDGTAGTFYNIADTNIHSIHNNHRYFRYKTYLSTESSTSTPSLSNISVTFSSLCIPPGQAFFSNLDTGVFTLTVSKNGYQDYIIFPLDIVGGWQKNEINLQPE